MTCAECQSATALPHGYCAPCTSLPRIARRIAIEGVIARRLAHVCRVCSAPLNPSKPAQRDCDPCRWARTGYVRAA